MYKIDDPKFIELIEKGVTFDRLERRLRPGKTYQELTQDPDFGDLSREGFIGKNERLLEIVHEDWKTVEQYGTTHAQIADALDVLFAGNYQVNPDYEYIAPQVGTAGNQSCPWSCKAAGQNKGVIQRKDLTEQQQFIAQISQMGNVYETLERNLKMCEKYDGKDSSSALEAKKMLEDYKSERAFTKKTVLYVPLTGLLPHLIKEHYFFEGKQTCYRADPEFLIKALNLAKQ